MASFRLCGFLNGRRSFCNGEMGKIAERQAGLRWWRYYDRGFTTIKHKTRAQDLVPGNNEVDAGGESSAVQGTLYAERDRNVINSAVWDEFVPKQHGLLPERQRRHLGRLGSRYTRRAGRSFGPVGEERHTLPLLGEPGGKQFHGLNVMRLQVPNNQRCWRPSGGSLRR